VAEHATVVQADHATATITARCTGVESTGRWPTTANRNGSTTAVTVSPDPLAAADTVLRALCWPQPLDPLHLPDGPVRNTQAGLGGLI
jgi:hypothetical protein